MSPMREEEDQTGLGGGEGLYKGRIFAGEENLKEVWLGLGC